MESMGLSTGWWKDVNQIFGTSRMLCGSVALVIENIWEIFAPWMGPLWKRLFWSLLKRRVCAKFQFLNAMDRFIHRAMMAYVLFANMKQLEFYGRFIFFTKRTFSGKRLTKEEVKMWQMETLNDRFDALKRILNPVNFYYFYFFIILNDKYHQIWR